MRREGEPVLDRRDLRRALESPQAEGAVSELLAAGWWHRRDDGRVRVLHGMDHQPEPEVIARRREAATERQRRKRLKAVGIDPDTGEVASRRDTTRDRWQDATRDPGRDGTGRVGAGRGKHLRNPNLKRGRPPTGDWPSSAPTLPVIGPRFSRSRMVSRPWSPLASSTGTPRCRDSLRCHASATSAATSSTGLSPRTRTPSASRERPPCDADRPAGRPLVITPGGDGLPGGPLRASGRRLALVDGAPAGSAHSSVLTPARPEAAPRRNTSARRSRVRTARKRADQPPVKRGDLRTVSGVSTPPLRARVRDPLALQRPRGAPDPGPYRSPCCGDVMNLRRTVEPGTHLRLNDWADGPPVGLDGRCGTVRAWWPSANRPGGPTS